MGMNGKYAVRIPNGINKKNPEFFFRYISPGAKVIDIKRYFLSFSVSKIERERAKRERESTLISEWKYVRAHGSDPFIYLPTDQIGIAFNVSINKCVDALADKYVMHRRFIARLLLLLDICSF